MAKDLRAIIGFKPEPKSYSLNPPKNPRAPGDEKAEDEFVNHVVSGATVVPDPTGNDVSTSKIAKAKKEAPDVSFKQKLGEEQVDELYGKGSIEKVRDNHDSEHNDADFEGKTVKAAYHADSKTRAKELIQKRERMRRMKGV